MKWERIKQVLFQISTLKGIFRGLSAIGILTLSPSMDDQVAELIVQIIGGCQALISVIDIVRDDYKGKTTVESKT